MRPERNTMQLAEITIEISATVQPRSYENIQRTFSAKVLLNPEDQPDEALQSITAQLRRTLGESYVNELRARIDLRNHRWIDTIQELRDYLDDNSLFQTIVANAPEAADALLNEFWAVQEIAIAERKAREAEAEAELKAKREAREAELEARRAAEPDVDGEPDDDEDDESFLENDDFDDHDEDETAESDANEDYDEDEEEAESVL